MEILISEISAFTSLFLAVASQQSQQVSYLSAMHCGARKEELANEPLTKEASVLTRFYWERGTSSHPNIDGAALGRYVAFKSHLVLQSASINNNFRLNEDFVR